MLIRKRKIVFLIVWMLYWIPSTYLCAQTSVSSVNGLKWAKDMADSEIKRYPQPWKIDFVKSPLWNYTQGLVIYAIQKLWIESDETSYLNYINKFADTFIKEDGTILTYDIREYSLDKINPGKVLFQLYHHTHNARYEKALKLLLSQIKLQPHTSENGYWHKQRYPHQMWLDGLYMASPFMAQYALEFNEPELFNDVITQIHVIQKHTLDSLSGLNFHGWDESHHELWSNPKTGCSPNIWARAEGWYFMALADVLDYLPANHPGRAEVLQIFQQLSAALVKVQDKQTGLWYQVMDKPGCQGNYLESSASCMFVYGLLKGIRLGYLPSTFQNSAESGFQGITTQFIRHNPDSTISITNACSVAGLGGNPYRDGSFKYYVNEPVRDNDPKAVGAFILAAIEYSLMKDMTDERQSFKK